MIKSYSLLIVLLFLKNSYRSYAQIVVCED